jgi:Uri superfamily endonuclease
MELGPGIIRYYGSAYGPGGIRTRVARHLRPGNRKSHWHVDALTSRVPVERVLVAPGDRECSLVQQDLDSGLWKVAAPGFGSSDCRTCQSHLLLAERGSA